jgi:diguanylate cyclase (GGDEF)-like protein/PAS domain S-box-containing protein
MERSHPLQSLGGALRLPLNQWIEDLANTEEQMRQLVEQLGVIMWIFDPATQKTFYRSSISEKVWGQEAKSEAIAIEAWLEAIHPEDRDTVRKAWSQSGRREPLRLEYRQVTATGEVRWLRDRSFWLPNRWVLVVEDVTGEKQAQQTLERQNQDLKRRVEQLEAELQQVRAQVQSDETTVKTQRSPIEIEDLVQHLIALIETVNEGITVSDYDGNFAIYNQKMAQITGYTGEEANNAENFLALLYPDAEDRQRAVEGIEASYQQGRCQDLETTIRAKDGTDKTLLVSTSSIDYQGKAWFLSAYRDISDRKRAEQALKLLAEREGALRTIAYNLQETLRLPDILKIVAEAMRNFLQVDRAIVYRFQADGDGEVVVESLTPDWPSARGWRWNALSSDEVQVVADLDDPSLEPELRDRLKPFQIRSQLLVPIPLNASEGDRCLWGLLCVHQCSQPRQWQPLEISLLSQLATQLGVAIEQAERYQVLESQATIDGLTQIANRRKFDEYIQQEWMRLARERQPLSLILCDVDFFKAYNDCYGHQFGDRCLQQVARCLQGTAKRAADLVARYGGEEFAIVLPNTPLSGAICIAQAIGEQIRLFNIPHAHSPVSDRVTLSLGVATAIPDPAQSSDCAIAAADLALYRAKAEGRDRVEIDPESF